MDFIYFIIICVSTIIYGVLIYFISTKYHNQLEEIETKNLIRKLVRKYTRLYKQEIKNSQIISMRDYVIELTLDDLKLKEFSYVKQIYKLYKEERKHIPKA